MSFCQELMLHANTFHFNSKRIVWCYTNMYEISLYNVQASSKHCPAVFPTGSVCFLPLHLVLGLCGGKPPPHSSLRYDA